MTDAMHSNVLAGTAGIGAGQVTMECSLRLARIVCSMDSATRAVSTFAFAPEPELSPDFEEPQALISAAHPSAVIATTAPRRGETPRVILKAGRSVCMPAYYWLVTTEAAVR